MLAAMATVLQDFRMVSDTTSEKIESANSSIRTLAESNRNPANSSFKRRFAS